MKSFEEIRTILREEDLKTILKEKSGKKLGVFSTAVFLIIAAMVFYAVFTLCGGIRLNQMNEYLEEIPALYENRVDEFRLRSRIYEDDIRARAELGLKLYCEENGQADAEKLERVRDAVGATNVSVVDGQTLEPCAPHFEFYPILTENGENTWKSEGKGLAVFSIPGDTEHNLAFEFSCSELTELYNILDDGSDLLDLIFPDGDGIAVARSGDKMMTSRLDGFTPEQVERLKKDADKAFNKTGKIIKLQSKRYLAVSRSYPQAESDVLLAVPVSNVVRNGIYIAVVITLILYLGMLLFQIYAFRRLIQQKDKKKKVKVTREWVCRETWPGILVVIVVTVVFSVMLLLLESRSKASVTAAAWRESIQFEIEWRKTQEKTVRNTFTEIYQKRTQMLADFLTERPDYQTHEGMKELSRIAQTDYLMRIGSNGQELVASNSYTGFNVGKNLSEDYRAVLMGYPSAIVGPSADPYTGQMQLGTAILMTDKNGMPDGFLLAIYNADDMNAELKRMSYENIVNTTIVPEGYIAAAINEADGRFVAHTDPGMIGLKAADFIEDYDITSNFDGFIIYNGVNMRASLRMVDGKKLVFMVPEREDSYLDEISLPVVLAVLLILVLLYYPVASLLIARATAEAEEKGKLQPADKVGSPMKVFPDGYSIFLTLFVIFVFLASANGWWTSFDYVLSWEWSDGLHLISLWAALFVIAITFLCVFLIRTILNRMENRLSSKSKTMTRLVNSLISYAAYIFLFFCILSMFGVNTKTLLASAGIISIAVGMGAQSMAADLLAGVFMMLEGTVRVGDHVSVGGVTGYVTDMGIRSTQITDEKGNVVILNNSKVNSVCNMSRKKAQQKVEDVPPTNTEDDVNDNDNEDE